MSASSHLISIELHRAAEGETRGVWADGVLQSWELATWLWWKDEKARKVKCQRHRYKTINHLAQLG